MNLADKATTTPIVGRRDEVGRLHHLLDLASHGQRQVVVVSGDLGIGKTSLVSDFLSSASSRVLVGQCLPVAGEAIPFAPVTGALRSLMRDLPPDEAQALARRWPRAFVDFLPFELLDTASGDADPSDTARVSITGQARLFEWLLNVTCELATACPVIWRIEDVQWADRSTLDFVSFLSRYLTSEPVMMILTLRTDDLDRDHPARRWLVELGRLPGVTRLTLQPLSHEATRAQVLQLMPGGEGIPDQTLTDLIYEHSDGNPLFTEQLIPWAHDDQDKWPDTLHDLIVTRLAELPASTRTALSAAAVLGRSFSLDLLAEVLEIAETDAERDLSYAIARGLVRPTPTGSYTFAQPLTREVLETELLPGERRRLHQTAALAKSGRVVEGSDSQFELVGEIAHHWDAAQVERKAFAAAVEAGLAAERLYALAEADRYLGRAVHMTCAADPEAYDDLATDRVDLLHHAAQAAHLVGDGPRAVQLISDAATLVDEPIRLAMLLERKGAYCFNAGRVDEADAAYREALRLLPEEPSTSRAWVIAGLGLLAMAWTRMDEAEARCEEAIRVARVVGARQAEGRALNALGVVTAYRGDFDEGIQHSREALEIAEELESADDLATAYIDLAHVLGLAGRFDEAAEVCRVGFDAMSRVGLARQDGSFLRANAAESLIKAGRWDEAANLLAKASSSQARGVRAFPVLEHEARLRLRKGEFDRAEECVDQARQLFAEFDAPDAWRREFHEVAAELLLWERRPQEALAEVEDGLGLIEGSDEERFAGLLILIAAQAMADLVDEARAKRELREVDDLTAQISTLKRRAQSMHPDPLTGADHPLPEAKAIALNITAEFVRCEGSPSAWDTWAEVATQWESLGQPFPTAYAYWREAEALVMSKHLGQRPVAAVRRAYEAATRLGAVPIANEVEQLARWGRVDLRPRPSDAEAESEQPAELGLTQREQEVLECLLAGQTNREIADELFISVKTSSVHVSNILRKLGVKSREEAARVAHRQRSGT